MATDLPTHARERLADMRERRLFTSDLSVNEFLLVKEAGFDPVGLVMGSSIYQIAPDSRAATSTEGSELGGMTRALNHARQLAMQRMEEEADELGADGVVGVRLTVNLGVNAQRQSRERYREWQTWARRAGFPHTSTLLGSSWADWEVVAAQMWTHWCDRMGWSPDLLAPWRRPRQEATYSLGPNVAEFVAIGAAIRHRGGESYRNVHGKPFQSDLSGQDFWTLIRCGYRPVGFVMGNCVYHVPPGWLSAAPNENRELESYTHALYDARELAIERLQAEAEALQATGVVGVTVAERQHSWQNPNWQDFGNSALLNGELIELFVVGTAVVPTGRPGDVERPFLTILANDAVVAASGEGE